MDSVTFSQIVPRCGGQREAFEELCCQLARLDKPPGSPFVRLRGAAGDGGVECYADAGDGSRRGWQAKFVFDMDSLLTQLAASLKTALRIHPNLTHYIVCFPFDPTGPTGRKGRSGIEKFNEWRAKHEASAAKKGRQLKIEDWPASRLIAELLKNDVSGGLRSYFFNATVFSESWFKRHLGAAVLAAGPRYTASLTVETPLRKWFDAFGRTAAWSQTFNEFLTHLDGELGDLRRVPEMGRQDPLPQDWPEALRVKAATCVESLATVCAAGAELLAAPSRDSAKALSQNTSLCLSQLRELESEAREDLEERHGKGTAESPGFRQFMAEYELSFPAGRLDVVREVLRTVDTFGHWLNSPEGWPAFDSIFLLLGIAGSGKTHGVCDAAMQRLGQGLLSIVVFGHNFGGEPDPWTRLREHLDLPEGLGRDGLLDGLNAAAEASGHPMIVWLDAINETKPLRFWREHLRPFADAIGRRPFLRLCVTCRSSFATYCVPEEHDWYQAEHLGFVGMEREACQAFFAHYNLDPPLVPILQPELANPLYLTLICKTLQAKGLKSLPPGWMGLLPAIQAFLSQKNHVFALEYGISEGASTVPKALSAVAREIARLGQTGLAWSAAEHIIRDSVTVSTALQPLDWLVRESLLIEDAPTARDGIEPESTVRPAFERLGDFLVAQELLVGVQPGELRDSCRQGGRLAPYVGSLEAIGRSEGVLSALSILVPEQFAKGTEFPDLLDSGPLRDAMLKIAVSSYLWRDPSSFTSASRANLSEALGRAGIAFAAMDSVLSLCSHVSAVDANWLHTVLAGRRLAVRDAFWCGYLHKSYEQSGPVRQLIDAALELPVANLDSGVAERWAIVLLWFTAAADRRVKDHATRAAIAVLREHPGPLHNVLHQMIAVDDDAVRERAALVAYGVCLLRKGAALLTGVCDVLADSVREESSRFHNALLRDHARSIAEFAGMLGINARGAELLALLDALRAPWPLEIPTDDQIKKWNDLPKLMRSCLDDDFYVYSMGCLDEWANAVPKMDMGKWILGKVAKDFGYVDSGCEGYDKYMLGTYGGGRSRPTWAERIGKKYQWIAMFQLAARLSDHAARKRDNWEPELLRNPLILLEERQLDPTLSSALIERQRGVQAWWIPASVDLSSSSYLSHEEWVRTEVDVPSLAQLVVPSTNAGKQWRLLNGYPTWDNRAKDEGHEGAYRQLWVHVDSFLVDYKEAENAFAGLAGRNFFGKWMPEGPSWLHGFAAEYPWAAAYNTEPEWYHAKGKDRSGLAGGFTPVNAELGAEWQYDASLPGNRYFSVPSRIFFEPRDLWWDGKDGFRRESGETVFRAPELTEPGPPAFIVRVDKLAQRLETINRRLIWTLLGEKLILGSPLGQGFARRTFSQVALLNMDGTVKFSKLTFFDDYNRARGFLQRTSRPQSGPAKATTSALSRKRKKTSERRGKLRVRLRSSKVTRRKRANVSKARPKRKAT